MVALAGAVLILLFIIISLVGLVFLIIGIVQRIKNRPDNDNRLDCDKEGL